MKGIFYIGDINVTSIYGIFIREGGYDGIVALPELKELEYNDWAEYDGIEVDLSNPLIKPKDIEIGFATMSADADVEGFIALLVKNIYNEFLFVDLGISITLRFIGGESHAGTLFNMRMFSLRFSDDMPFSDYVYEAPVGGRYGVQGYEIDGIDLSAFGIQVLRGSEAEVIKPAQLKSGLYISNSTMSGQFADANYMAVGEKDVKLNLLITGGDSADFFRNLNAFIYKLIAEGERKLYFAKSNETYDCYYKGSSVVRFDMWWMEFTLILTLISPAIVRYLYFISRSGYLVATDNKNMSNDDVIIFSSIKPSVEVSEVVAMSSSYSDGKVMISVSSELGAIDMDYSNGKFIIQ